MSGPGTTGRRGVTSALAEWIAESSPEEVPAEVREAAKLVMLDGFGAGLFGSTTPWGRIAADYVRASGQGEEAVLWGTHWKVPASQAPFANGTSVHAFELDDVHPTALIHVAAHVLPAALAALELRARGPASGERPAWLPQGRPDGRALLHAVVLGFETGARIGLACGPGQLRRGFHPSPNTGLFAAAAASARLLGLDARATLHALAIAGSLGGSLMAAQYGGMLKRFHGGHPAQMGLQATLLAARGATGPADLLEAAYGGFARAYADVEPGALADVAADLGRRWETPKVSLKAYPSCASNHTAIDALSAILKEHPDVSGDDIASIEVRTSRATLEHVGWPYEPFDETSAQMNLAYTVAVLAYDRELFVEQYRAERLREPRLLSLAARVRVAADPEIDGLGREGRHTVELTVETKDGRRWSRRVAHARGSSAHPLTREEVIGKFRRLAASCLDPASVAALEERVLGLEALADATELADCLAHDGGSAQATQVGGWTT